MPKALPFLLPAAIWGLLALPAPGRAGEACYLLLFGSQRAPNDPNDAHTFAAFVRASWPGDGPAPADPALEVRTISWLAASGRVRSTAWRPEPGRNFPLDETLRMALAAGAHVSVFGPYEVRPELFERAGRQVDLLESGCVLYKANDGGYRSDHVSNCIHAVEAVAEGQRLHWISPWWGEPAAWVVLMDMRSWVIDPCRTYPWVGSALGLDAYPLRSREGYSVTTAKAMREQLHTVISGGAWPEPTYGPPAR